MAFRARVAAETDCCGNLYPVHVPPAALRDGSDKGPSLTAIAATLAARAAWAFTLLVSSLL
jgi:hypothetical protein